MMSFPRTRQWAGRVFSGIQPTGVIHLGNYLGAIKNWVLLQEESLAAGPPVFCVVDLHSLTTDEGRSNLRGNVLMTTSALLACGVDPKKSILYNQSQVPFHAELNWILSCITPLHMLNTMIQYKEKVKTAKEARVGLFNYPVLMAADILAFRATHVPVGEDQMQHLQLARNLADRFNRYWNTDIFPIPAELRTRVMSLRDPTKKMSKSDPIAAGRLSLLDTDDEIALKLQRAKTDSLPGVQYDRARRPEVANLIDIYAALSNRLCADIAAEHKSADMAQFKRALTEVVVAHLRPIRTQMLALQRDPEYLVSVLHEGSTRARELAAPTVRAVRDLVGLI